MNNLAEAFIPIIAIIFTFGIPGALIFWFLYIKHKERTKLMDMGLSPQEARDYFKEQERKPKNPLSSMKWGILLTMIGLGLFIGILLDEAGFKDSLTGVMVLLFGGLGFIIYYFVASSKIRKEDATKIAQQNNNAGSN
jgi:membrane protease YdiL (CAAX protease family)